MKRRKDPEDAHLFDCLTDEEKEALGYLLDRVVRPWAKKKVSLLKYVKMYWLAAILASVFMIGKSVLI